MTVSNNTDGIVIVREYVAPPEAVFSAWVTPESFARWFGGRHVRVPADRLDYRAEVGRGWSATMVLPDDGTVDWAGEFVELDPPSRLVMTLTDEPGEGNASVLTLDLTPTEAGTRLRMSQETPGFSAEQRDAVTAGWQSFLDVLGEIAEEG